MGLAYRNHSEFPQYLISECGRVFSLRSGRLLKPIKMGEYLGLTITDASGRLAKRYVHRLVLEATSGPCPPDMEARHLNGNRHDNRAANLIWGTKRQNQMDKITHGTIPHGAKNGMAKLTWEQAEQIRALVRAGAVQRRMAEKFSVSPMTVSRIVRSESWQEAYR